MSTGVGILLALSSAIFKSTKTITTKIAANGTDEYITSFSTRIIGTIIFFLLVVIFQDLYFPNSDIFMLSLTVNSILLGLTTVLFTKALKISDVSLVSPIMAVLPVLVTLPAFVILEESPTILSGFGLVLVGIGSYALNLKEKDYGYLRPIKDMKDNKGIQYAVAGLVVASFIPSFDKIGIQSSDPFTWVLFQHLGSSIVLFIVLILTESSYNTSKREKKILFLMGIANALIWVFQSHAYKFAQVSYVQAVKRVSILLSVLIGHYYFGEENLSNRLSGAILILLGVIFVIFGA